MKVTTITRSREVKNIELEDWEILAIQKLIGPTTENQRINKFYMTEKQSKFLEEFYEI